VSRCPLCGGPVDPQLLAQTTELHPPVRRLVQSEHPNWRPQEGICPTCARDRARRHARRRSPVSLHTHTFPHTTFPYYHPEEFTVLSQWERLPHHPGFDGQGIGVAFLDSGYYPHPDFVAGSLNLRAFLDHIGSPARVRRFLEGQGTRVRQYANLVAGRAHTGFDLPSLWSDAPSSWHGQMTAALAAGNGSLSEGRFRAYAPAATMVWIKIGRPNGSIPEPEILAGLRWLLAKDHLPRLGIRVVNISVGGDHPQSWWENPVCLAVEALTQAGVLVVAAAGNSGREELLAPAQAPSAITVGGMDDGNRRWRVDRPKERRRLRLYRHSYGRVWAADRPIGKPELLAPACWLPAPVLPGSPICREMWVLGRAWQALDRGRADRARQLLWRHRDLLALTAPVRHAGPRTLRRLLRFRMNRHKWVHPFYQHVDGTSVSAPQVAAVAAQMFQAHPGLTPQRAKALLMASALPLDHLPQAQTGAGLLQPARAVALALRDAGGPLAGFPVSGTRLESAGLRELGLPVQAAQALEAGPGPQAPAMASVHYLGTWAPEAQAVSLVGSFNGWRPGVLPLYRTDRGWWHTAVAFPPGEHLYRFWVVDRSGNGRWQLDGENPVREESGYLEPHNVIVA